MSKWADFIIKNVPDYRVHITSEPFVTLVKELKKYGKTFLEYGCGSGYTAIDMANSGFKVWGYDQDDELIKFACAARIKQLLTAKGEVIFTAERSDLDLVDGGFDIVFSQGLLEHYDNEKIIELLDDQLALANIAVVFSVPSNKYPRLDMGDERLLSLSEWETILKPVYGDKLFELHYYGDRLHIIGIIEK